MELSTQTLRGDLIAVVAATFIASLGLAALALYALRKRSADVTPLAFAAFALIYASRLAIATRTIQAALSESGGLWEYIDAALRVMWKAAPDSEDCACSTAVVPIVHKAIRAGSRRERMEGYTVNPGLLLYQGEPVLAVCASRWIIWALRARARDHTWTPPGWFLRNADLLSARVKQNQRRTEVDRGEIVFGYRRSRINAEFKEVWSTCLLP